jgi:hypothetical protein
MIYYLEAIITRGVGLGDDSCTSRKLEAMQPCSTTPETDEEFHVRLSINSNAVACKKQVHSSNYNATCFRYSQKGQGKDACRFGMSQDLLPRSKVDDLGVIHLAQNHGWVNLWNLAIAN